jgi:flavin-dependent dehydrogenase
MASAAKPSTSHYDVAIIGGGPGGSTTATLLKKYNPDLRVIVLEKEKFPRDHIGESQLPAISRVLNEMGVWPKIERAGFPIKLGATYTWGQTTTPWIFEFVPAPNLPPKEAVQRPGEYAGWRTQTAFQVDRSVYDTVLLDHAESMGAEVRQSTAVAKVLHENGTVNGLQLANGDIITARHYVDASGNVAILRRALGIPCDIPTALMNVAFWDYWEDDKWLEDDEMKGTRVHVRSLPYGWVWCIRIGPRRMSVGLVTPGDYYKKCGKKPAELYQQALDELPDVTALLSTATRRGMVEGTTDWSFVVQQTYGPNWFLVGECAGFADPILAAGLTLTHAGARELAYTILELDRGEHEREWLLERYHALQTRRVRQHMRFAEFWYSANGLFSAVQENCKKIAEESGINFASREEAFRWLSLGGLSDDFIGVVGLGGQDLASARHLMHRISGQTQSWLVDGKNCFELNLANAKESTTGILKDGRIERVRCWRRGERELAEIGVQGLVVQILRVTDDPRELLQRLQAYAAPHKDPHMSAMIQYHAVQVLEWLTQQNWVFASYRKDRPAMRVVVPEEGYYIHTDKGESNMAQARI